MKQKINSKYSSIEDDMHALRAIRDLIYSSRLVK